MPEPVPQAYYGDFEQPQPSPLERIKPIVEKAAEAVKKFGVKKFIAILALLLIAYLYLFVIPKSGSLEIQVVELDNEGAGIEGAEVVVLADGSAVGTGGTDADGYVRLGGIPSMRDLTVNVEAVGKFGRASKNVKLESGEAMNLKLAAPLKRDLEIAGAIPATVLAPKCSKTFTVEVRNTGAQEEAVEFVGDGLSGFTFSSEQKTVPPGGSEQISFTIGTGETAKGATGYARIKFTDLKVRLSLTGGEAPKLEVSPSEVRCSQVVCNQIITIKNNGKSTVTDIEASTRGAPALTDKIRFEGITAPTVAKALPPGGEAKFALVIEGVDVGSYTAFVDVDATCFSKSIGVRSERTQ